MSGKRTYTPAEKRAYAARMKRKNKAKTKSQTKKTTIASIAKAVVKSENLKQVETFRSGSRLMRQVSLATPGGTFGGCRFFLGNVGGKSPIQLSSFTEMNTMKATAINQDVATGLSVSNNTFNGKYIYGKHLRSNITFTMPSIRTQGVGTADQQQIPINYAYRAIYFKQKKRPAATQYTVAAGLAAQPIYSLFRNEIGTAFGVSSSNATCLPEVDSPASNGPWYNTDLMDTKVNTQSFEVLKEYRGRVSVGSSMNATANSAVITSGSERHPSQVRFSLHYPINKKLLMTQGSTSSQTVEVSTPLNFDTSIYFTLILDPVGEPGTYESTWNNAVEPYIDINNTFAWTDQ